MTDEIQHNRGSEWRKWDLHVHSPNTHLENKYKGVTTQNFLEKINDKNISVIGLTNYFKFAEKDFILKKELENKGIVVFLNLEIRLAYQNIKNDCCDAHIIFDSSVTKETIKNFLTKLNVTYRGTEKIAQNLSDTEEFKKVTVEFKHLLEVLNEEALELSEKYLIGFLSRGKGTSRSSTNHEKIEKKSHFLIHSSDMMKNLTEDRDYWLKQNKPLLQSSDAHKLDDIGAKFTWIKADTTFEGLKQIIYEPEGRVRMPEEKLEEKQDYQMIDKVKFIDDSFIRDEILINQNLTTIIGGKSTGKSILLRNIAQTIDDGEVSKRLEDVGLEEYTKQVSDFNVVWKDRQENEKNKNNGVNKKIIYIPQSYLNRLVDKNEDKTSIDDIIQGVLEQEEHIKNVFSQLQEQNRDIEKNITQNIGDFFYKKHDIETLNESIKKIGDKKGIEAEIEKLKKEVAELEKKAGMSGEEIKNYNNLLEKIRKLKSDQEKIKQDSVSLVTLNSQENFGIFENIQSVLDSLHLNIQEVLKEKLNVIKEEAETKWKEQLEAECRKLEKQNTENQDELKTLNKSFNPLLEKAKKSNTLAEKIKNLEEEEKKLKEIINQENNYKILEDEYETIIKNIAENHSKFFDNFFNAKTEILKQKSITEDQDLEFEIKVRFKKESFQTHCINIMCDQRQLSNFKDVSLRDYEYSNETAFKNDIEKIIKGILSGKVTLISSFSKQAAITKLVQNWFVFDYRIKQNGDEISEMSPGKKSFVLLKLLIELDNSKCPILLDQPEDDLDNRSIYNDLVNFIKTKKKERQIIIATHNPNLVVGADAECIIVANQEGNKSKNITRKFQYVQGALENTQAKDNSKNILVSQGIREHVCDILEGGVEAFKKREAKYGI